MHSENAFIRDVLRAADGRVSQPDFLRGLRALHDAPPAEMAALAAELLPLLVDRLAYEQVETRRLAVASLGALGTAALPALPSLRELLDDPEEDLTVRRLVLDGLPQILRDSPTAAAEMATQLPSDERLAHAARLAVVRLRRASLAATTRDDAPPSPADFRQMPEPLQLGWLVRLMAERARESHQRLLDAALEVELEQRDARPLLSR